MTDSKRYYLETLRHLMGPARRDDLLPGWRIDMIGQPEKVQADGDEGLALLEVRPDGVYVKVVDDDHGRRSDEISSVTGDTQGRRKSGLPLLPIPFTVEELRLVQGGSLGIVEGIFCGEETEEALAKLGFLDPEAEEVARALGIANPRTSHEAEALLDYATSEHRLKETKPVQEPDPQKRFTALSALGADVKSRRSEWSATASDQAAPKKTTQVPTSLTGQADVQGPVAPQQGAEKAHSTSEPWSVDATAAQLEHNDSSTANWPIKPMVIRDDGLTGAVHRVLMDAHKNGALKPPSARDVLEIFRSTRTPGIARVHSDCCDYSHSSGEERSAGIPDIQRRIEEITRKSPRKTRASGAAPAQGAQA